MPASIQLHIPEPCHENWNNMSPQEKGRFCGSCRKTVVDFSLMTDREIADYISKASHNVCGRFSNDQLNKPLPVTNNKKRYSLAYVWNVLLATLLITKANAQVKPVKPKKPATVKWTVQPTMGIIAYKFNAPPIGVSLDVKGYVFDATNNLPLSGASVRVKETAKGIAADTSGHFILRLEKKDARILEFSAIGYESQTVEIDDNVNWRNMQVFLKPVVSNLKEVAVIGYNTTGGNVRLGGVSYGYRISKAEKIKRTINDWSFKKDVKIYPNPVVRGNSIHLSLSLKQSGEYKLELLNSSGQVVMVQPLIVQSKEQVFTISTEHVWSAGIYWLRISSPQIKTVYESKLLLQ